MTRSRARERASRLSHLACALTLHVPAERHTDISGSVTVTFALADARSPLVLDFDQPAGCLQQIVVNDKDVDALHVNGHITIPPGALAPGVNTVAIAFLAGNAPLNRREDLLYSLFVPSRASQAFPCFDQPDLKTCWTLTLVVPSGWQAVSNTRASSRTTDGGDTTIHFATTRPLPTYLFAFAAGRLDVLAVTSGAHVLQVFHRETNTRRLDRNIEALVASHEQAIAWLEDYTAIPYPFDTLDVVLIPSMQFGGMEHAGAIFYDADLVLLDESASQARQLARANVIAHETAHMWFGNLVTMTWFDDVWLKEVFANFMAAKIVNPAFPGMDHDHRFLVQHYPAAYGLDRTAGATAIRQPLENLDDAGSLYGPAIYQKAPIVMRQLERLMGDEPLRDALREYLAIHAFGNAAWPDLLRVLVRHTSHDLEQWSHAWIDEPGRPTLAVESPDKGSPDREWTLRQRDVRGRGLVWQQQVQVLAGRDGATVSVDITLTEPAAPLTIAGSRPDWILPFGGGLAYGGPELDDATMAFLTAHLHELHDPLTRSVAALSLWDAMLDGQLSPRAAFDALLTALGAETDELTLQVLLSQVQEAFWRFTPAREWSGAAVGLESVLRTGTGRANNTSTRAAWFGTLRTVAVTDPTLDWLEGLLARTETISGLPLAESDETALALELAIRRPDRAERFMAAQLSRVTDPDRLARLVFLAQSVSPDEAARRRLFDGLMRPGRQRPEAWVLDAMRYLNHPIRLATSSRFVRPALEHALALQQAGDIFFPKRWIEATLWGCQSREVAREVQEFILALPARYPPRLKRTLLAAADPLMRAARHLA